MRRKSNIGQFIAFISMLFCVIITHAQIKVKVYSTRTKEPIIGAAIRFGGNKKGLITDSLGKFLLAYSSSKRIELTISSSGFETKDTIINTVSIDTTKVLTISLKEKNIAMEDVVVVASSKTNSHIEDLPTKVEVIGAEEVTEEGQIKPGNIASLLNDVAGVQIQQTNAATGGTDMRLQGINGKYTQLLIDGLPLYGGYGGSFSILQIPPLDLQQIEIIKGNNSTLYGGGAIAGMVNLILKTPKLNKPEHSITINRSTLLENNVNTFHSYRNNNIGYTLFAGGTYQHYVDVDKDGFSDLPSIKNIFVHPRIFIYGKHNTEMVIGYTLTYEDRNGGDTRVLDNHADAQHQFFIRNKSLRNTADISWNKKLNSTDMLTAKGSISLLDRQIETNVFGMGGLQNLWYTELAYNKNLSHHKIVGGINISGDDFTKYLPDSSLLNNENRNTIGAFIQDDWRLNNQWVMQGGIRLDNHNLYGAFLLPHLSLMYRPNKKLTFRLGGGMGYKNPETFTTDMDERDYHYLKSINNTVSAERSMGANCDVNYKIKMENWNITFNQTLFYTDISKPITLDSVAKPYFYYNENKSINTLGSETYIAAKSEELELYFGYVYTDAKRSYNAINSTLPLVARHKLASIITLEMTDNFRIGVEATYFGHQYLDDGSKTSDYLFGALMLNYKIRNFSFVLNCENILDYRQNKTSSIASPPYTNPSFKEIWAPIDGRSFNLSLLYKW